MDSRSYWEERYLTGGNSGAGARGDAAIFKAGVVNALVEEFSVGTVLDLGCGDGYVARHLQVPQYVGTDVSQMSIQTCVENLESDSKSFFLLGDKELPKVDAVLSMDVVLHLIEDEVFEAHVRSAFDRAERLVIFYSTNHDGNDGSAPHVRHRRLTDWIDRNITGWGIVRTIESPIPDDVSAADFYIYKP